MIKLRRCQNLSMKPKKKLSNLNLTMEVSLPNSISFEKGLMFLLKKKTEKTTYRCINWETKKINSISFQNFQKLFLENDMTRVDKKKEFIYTIMKSTGKNEIQRMLLKNFNENAYLKKLNRENA